MIWPFTKEKDADCDRRKMQEEIRATSERITDLVDQIHEATASKKNGMAR